MIYKVGDLVRAKRLLRSPADPYRSTKSFSWSFRAQIAHIDAVMFKQIGIIINTEPPDQIAVVWMGVVGNFIYSGAQTQEYFTIVSRAP